MTTLAIGVIGCGYWGPNLIRNFALNEKVKVKYVCDISRDRMDLITRTYPTIKGIDDYHEVLQDKEIDAVAIATPVGSHFEIGHQALLHGKHVLMEKPMASSSKEADQLVNLAQSKGLVLMVDHVFVYTGAVRKIKELVRAGEIGDLLYYDGVRINLGQFQRDVNVIWDLAPHDFSIMGFVLDRFPKSVHALGSSHVKAGMENTAYVTCRFSGSLMAHFHFNWLSPVKIRRTLIGGTKKMIIYDDLDPVEKVKVYDRGVDLSPDPQEIHKTLISYRTGDVWAPVIDMTEGLKRVCDDFLDSILMKKAPLSDGIAGYRVVRMLEAAQESLISGDFVDIPE
jgi:predicted dehydrogenase